MADITQTSEYQAEMQRLAVSKFLCEQRGYFEVYTNIATRETRKVLL